MIIRLSMIKKITLSTLYVLFVFLTSCQKDKVELTWETKSFTENDMELCNEIPCPEITVEYLHFQGDDLAASKINEKISEFIINSLELNLETPSDVESIDEAAENFATIYYKDLQDFPEMTGEYVSKIRIKELYSDSEIISLEMFQYLYSGGAHGYSSTHFMNLNPKTGKEYSMEDIFTDSEAFKAYAETKFRQDHGISPEAAINETGFWFNDNTFSLPTSFGFTSDSLIFIYNQYDIASYADGSIELRMSKNDVATFLKPLK